jgi:hypothetical protein
VLHGVVVRGGSKRLVEPGFCRLTSVAAQLDIGEANHRLNQPRVGLERLLEGLFGGQQMLVAQRLQACRIAFHGRIGSR